MVHLWNKLICKIKGHRVVIRAYMKPNEDVITIIKCSRCNKRLKNGINK